MTSTAVVLQLEFGKFTDTGRPPAIAAEIINTAFAEADSYFKHESWWKRVKDDGSGMNMDHLYCAYRKDKHEVLGCIFLYFDEATKIGSFSHFAVPSRNSGLGVGSFMLRSLEEYFARTCGAVEVRMTVVYDIGRTALHKWYAARGYEMTDEFVPFPHPEALLDSYRDLKLVYFSKPLLLRRS